MCGKIGCTCDSAPSQDGPWSWSIVPDGANAKSILFTNDRTGESFYADGRGKENDIFKQFNFSESAVKRILAHLNGDR